MGAGTPYPCVLYLISLELNFYKFPTSCLPTKLDSAEEIMKTGFWGIKYPCRGAWSTTYMFYTSFLLPWSPLQIFRVESWQENRSYNGTLGCKIFLVEELAVLSTIHTSFYGEFMPLLSCFVSHPTSWNSSNTYRVNRDSSNAICNS